jgi:hypothetical protein
MGIRAMLPPGLPRASGQGGHWKLDEKLVPVGRDGFSEHWGKIRHQADADRFFVHDYRHTSTKRKREAGVPTSVIMMFQRWKTEPMLCRYARVVRNDKLAALKAQEQSGAGTE